jgi:acyl carrier protein phosphodiesterase
VNFLAHIYLSGTNKEIIIGNFIADRVKGKKYNYYPKHIKIGILLHREIDSFTDTHPIFKQSAKRLRDRHRHYSGVIVDMFYDHFLAKNWNNYSDITLENFASDFYDIVQEAHDCLPREIQYMLNYMIPNNWLLSYASKEGIDRALSGLSRRVKVENKMHEAMYDLEAHYEELEAEFTRFFEEILVFSKEKLEELISNHS